MRIKDLLIIINHLLPKTLPKSPFLDSVFLGKVDERGDGQYYHLPNHHA